MSERGYFGIGIYCPNRGENVGTILRSAHAFGADFTFTIGTKGLYRQCSNTTKAHRHMPHYEYTDWRRFMDCMPVKRTLVAVETGFSPLSEFSHPERAVYLLGNEAHGLPREVLAECDAFVTIPGDYCLNVATAGSIVLFDRFTRRVVTA